MLTLLVLAPSFAFSAAAVSAQIDPPTVRQSRNGEFMTKYYPPTARSRGEQGKVTFQLGVDDDGVLTSCEVIESSGFKNLDRETCAFLIKYGKIKPGRDSTGRTVATTMRGYMNWKLPPGSRRLAMTDTATSLNPDKQICRRYVRTGSKASYIKICLTSQEWAEKDRLNREEARRMQDVGGSCSDGNPPPCDR